jgi:predicted enzyme related to lactoylglutathione lyase
LAEFTSHTPGTPSWVDLSTTDQKAGVAFYRSLFDWGVDEQRLSLLETYSLFRVRGKDVAGAFKMPAAERKNNVPPHWSLYVTVADAAQTAAQAKALGGKVLVQPTDVADAGRIAVVQDPTGAVLYLWQPKKTIGAKILNEPGSLCFSQLTTRDPETASRFYVSLFGWTAKKSPSGAGPEYTEFRNNGQPGIGMSPMPPGAADTVPSYWMPYFQVSNCDTSVALASRLGGSIVVVPQDIPNSGRIAIVKDPQGAVFALFQPATAASA